MTAPTIASARDVVDYLKSGAVLEHARNEEELEFTALEAAVGEDELAKLADAVAVAERIAPTRPHPGVESAAANFAAGPFASILDRARDALNGAFGPGRS